MQKCSKFYKQTSVLTGNHSFIALHDLLYNKYLASDKKTRADYPLMLFY